MLPTHALNFIPYIAAQMHKYENLTLPHVQVKSFTCIRKNPG